MALKTAFTFALLRATYCSASIVSLPLTRQDGSDDSIINGPRHVHQFERFAGHPAFTVVPETFPVNTFWQAPFDVGAAKNLNLTIDTGSPFVVTNAGLYKPSPSGVNAHQSGNVSYVGTQPDACGTLTIFYDQYNDTVSVDGVSSKRTPILATHRHKANETGEITQIPKPFAGIVGFSNIAPEYAAALNQFVWFATLCNQSRVDECRFGVAYGTSGKGKQVLGGVDDSLYTGTLSFASLYQGVQWGILGAVKAKDSTITSKAQISFDTGTPNIQGPIAQVRKIFNELGLQTSTRKESDCAGGTVIFGFYPCDSPPPAFSLVLAGQTFEVNHAAAALKTDGHNNCTSTLVGVDYGAGESEFWLVGQSFMQGKYLDFDVTGQKMGFALLKDPSGAA